MLSTIREKTQGWFAGIILGLIAIPFALWGINYYFDGGSLKVAEVSGIDVSVDQYRRKLDNQRRALQQSLGRNVDPRMLEGEEFKRRVLDGVIDEILINQEISEQGYRVADAELVRQIRSEPQFQRDGQFDPKLYELLLRTAGMEARGFEGRLRNEVLMRQAESGYAQTAIVTDSEVQFLAKLVNQERETELAIMKPASVRQRVKIPADAIEREYNQNPGRYQTEERVRIEYIRLATDDLIKGIQLGRDELQQAVREAEQAQAPREERRASHILIKLPAGADPEAEKAAMARIQGLRAKLLAGGNFADLARKFSEDSGSAKKGGDLGTVPRGMMVGEFEQALYALGKTGDLSAPVRTQYGLHLIKLTALNKSPIAKVDRNRIERELKARKAEQRFIELSEQFHNLVYEQPDSLRPAAETLGLRIEQSDWFTRTSPPSGIIAVPRVREAAFEADVLEQHRNSQAIEVGTNALVALRILGHEPSRQLPLKEVQNRIEATLLADAQKREADNLAQQMAGKLAAGASLSALAREYGMEVRGKQTLKRKSRETDQALLEAVFKTSRPAGRPATGAVAMGDGGVAIFAVHRVIEPDKVVADSAEVQALRRMLESHRGRDYFGNYRAGLRQQAKVKVYKDQL